LRKKREVAVLYVPVVPYVPHDPPSPRTRELAGLLSRVIEEYEKHHPAVTGAEVRGALDLAARDSKAGSPAEVRAVVGILAGFLVLLGGVGFFFARGGSIDAESMPMVAVSIAILVLLVGVVLLKKASGR
jgi:hypothetical protein